MPMTIIRHYASIAQALRELNLQNTITPTTNVLIRPPSLNPRSLNLERIFLTFVFDARINKFAEEFLNISYIVSHFRLHLLIKTVLKAKIVCQNISGA